MSEFDEHLQQRHKEKIRNNWTSFLILLVLVVGYFIFKQWDSHKEQELKKSEFELREKMLADGIAGAENYIKNRQWHAAWNLLSWAEPNSPNSRISDSLYNLCSSKCDSIDIDETAKASALEQIEAPKRQARAVGQYIGERCFYTQGPPNYQTDGELTLKTSIYIVLYRSQKFHLIVTTYIFRAGFSYNWEGWGKYWIDTDNKLIFTEKEGKAFHGDIIPEQWVIGTGPYDSYAMQSNDGFSLYKVQ